MSGSRVAKRYAKALFKMSNEDIKKGAQYAQALLALSSLFDLPEAKAVLQSPVMPSDLKLSLLNYAVAKAAAPEEMLRFVAHVESAGRTSQLPAISEQFQELLNNARGVLQAVVKSAVSLSPADLAQLKEVLQEKFGKKIDVSPAVDSTIGAGLWIGVGNSVIDLTLRTRLSALVANASC